MSSNQEQELLLALARGATLASDSTLTGSHSPTRPRRARGQADVCKQSFKQRHQGRRTPPALRSASWKSMTGMRSPHHHEIARVIGSGARNTRLRRALPGSGTRTRAMSQLIGRRPRGLSEARCREETTAGQCTISRNSSARHVGRRAARRPRHAAHWMRREQPSDRRVQPLGVRPPSKPRDTRRTRSRQRRPRSTFAAMGTCGTCAAERLEAGATPSDTERHAPPARRRHNERRRLASIADARKVSAGGNSGSLEADRCATRCRRSSRATSP